jgi:hypothetical protein
MGTPETGPPLEPLSREDLVATAAAGEELGPEHTAVLVDSFLSKVEKEIDARVDARLAKGRKAVVSDHSRGVGVVLPLGSIVLAIPHHRSHRRNYVRRPSINRAGGRMGGNRSRQRGPRARQTHGERGPHTCQAPSRPRAGEPPPDRGGGGPDLGSGSRHLSPPADRHQTQYGAQWC